MYILQRTRKGRSAAATTGFSKVYRSPGNRSSCPGSREGNVKSVELQKLYQVADVNPLGDWTGGTDVDTGATNRKLGSDMADSVTGGGLHGKDLSKADVSINIHTFLEAQRTGRTVEICCAIGDEEVDGIPYEKIVEEAREYIDGLGGFEKFAEWGLY